MQSDSSGRFLFIKGLIDDVKVTIANLYAPNCQQNTFIKRHLGMLQRFSEGQLIVGGDLNIPLAQFHNLQLIDAWRLFHPGERDYSFYSRPHQTYSCLDYLLVPHNQLQAIKNTSIRCITWSDHAPVTMRYALSDFYRGQRKPWRLNERLLQNPEVLADVTQEIKH